MPPCRTYPSALTGIHKNFRFRMLNIINNKPIRASILICPWARLFRPLSASLHYRYQTADRAKYEPPRNATHVFLSSPYPPQQIPTPKVVAPQPIYKLRPILSLKAPVILHES